MKAQELTFASIVHNGHLNNAVRGAIARALSGMEGKVVKITLAERKKLRSPNQNAFYWGVVVPAVLIVLKSYGNTHADDEMAHEVAKDLFLPASGIRKAEYRGRTVELRSSSDLNTTEWEDYVEAIRVWCAENGVQIPYPNEM